MGLCQGASGTNIYHLGFVSHGYFGKFYLTNNYKLKFGAFYIYNIIMKKKEEEEAKREEEKQARGEGEKGREEGRRMEEKKSERERG